MATETKTFYPGAHDTSDYSYNSITGAANPVGKGSSNTTYATITVARKGAAYLYWPFDVSSIPNTAEITSITAKAKANTALTSSPVSIQLCSGTVLKGSPTSFTTTATAEQLSPGTWTRAELEAIRLKVSAPGNDKKSFDFYFYGADLVVHYTYQSEKFMLKLSGDYEDVARTFKKVSGIWVEQESLEGVVDTSKKLVNGGEIN